MDITASLAPWDGLWEMRGRLTELGNRKKNLHFHEDFYSFRRFYGKTKTSFASNWRVSRSGFSHLTSRASPDSPRPRRVRETVLEALLSISERTPYPSYFRPGQRAVNILSSSSERLLSTYVCACTQATAAFGSLRKLHGTRLTR